MTIRNLLVCLAAVPLVAVLAVPLSTQAAAAPPGASRYIVVWRDTADSDRETDDFERSEGTRSDFRYSHAIKGFAATLTPAQVARLERHPNVKFISQDRDVQAIGSVPIVAGDSAPGGVRRIEAATSTTASQASTAAVAVIDTGIQLTHADLNAVAGKNCVTTGASPNDDNGHGTHVSGTIAANNNGTGVVGVAPGTTLYAVKVLNAQGSGTWAQVICGIDWVTANAAAFNIRVASMSLGGTGSNDNNCGNSNFDALHQAICRSTAAGVTYVVAAGNSAANFASSSPASYPEALTVTAMSDSDGLAGGTGGAPTCRTGETDDAFATFSNFAVAATEVNHTVAGPGVCILSTWLSSGYNTISGTSMATPHLSGTVALCIGSGGSAGPCNGLTPAQIVQKIRADAQGHATAANGFSGDPLHPVTGKYFGYLAYAGGYGTPDTTPPTITAVTASTTATSATIKWTTNEPASSQVEYWIGSNAATATPVTDTAPLVTSHTVTINGLASSTTYGYHVKSADSSGNAAQSTPDSSFVTQAPDTTAPTITNVKTTSITTSGATIAWTTDEAATSQVQYCCVSGATTSTPVSDTAGVTAHSVQLTGLTPNTGYTYNAISKDLAGNVASSPDQTFTTAAGSNDSFANAFAISPPTTINGNNRGATRQPSEPRPCGSIGATVWYLLTPSAAGTLTATTVGGNTNYDTVLAIYRGTTLSNLSRLACNDDTGGTLQSRVSASVSAGQTYYIQLGGYNSATGDFTLQVTFP